MKTHILKSKCAQYRAPQIAKEKGIYPYYKAIETEQSTVVKIKGKDVLMFGSNSYLGLSNDPRLKEAAKAAIDKYGTSCWLKKAISCMVRCVARWNLCREFIT